ncbi:nuclear transport factor 2 family protein [Rheinheimera aquimaris]|uniref:Nuclear transport factor 2 family protein n=1 Tax=Rheinheimera aquimaris TaxID=412437 RepID=A0ABN1DZK6_9GAMM|nr:nuclear transport factor 2 family protein [Rheinheimera aquimaris]MCB5213633.1 nuclear transport factor 2 family protein [Rheinheimera aquimaris]
MTTSKHVFKAFILLWGLMNVEPVLAKSDDAITQQNKQFIAQAFQQWADGGGTFFQDVLSTDVIWTIKGTGPAAGIYRGRDAFIEQAVAPFAARLSSFVKPTVNNIWADGNDVVVYWDGAGVAKDGKPYNNSFVWIFKMENLRATEVIAFLDLSQYEDVINRIQLTATP